MRGRRGWQPVAGVVVALLLLTACQKSPHRGSWSGTFTGDVTGVVDFEINGAGTEIEGSMDGETREGQPFVAEIEGILRTGYIDATFQGRATSNGLPVPFEGRMTGDLEGSEPGDGRGGGEWEATLSFPEVRLRGTFDVEQVADE